MPITLSQTKSFSSRAESGRPELTMPSGYLYVKVMIPVRQSSICIQSCCHTNVCIPPRRDVHVMVSMCKYLSVDSSGNTRTSIQLTIDNAGHWYKYYNQKEYWCFLLFLLEQGQDIYIISSWAGKLLQHLSSAQDTDDAGLKNVTSIVQTVSITSIVTRLKARCFSPSMRR